MDPQAIALANSYYAQTGDIFGSADIANAPVPGSDAASSFSIQNLFGSSPPPEAPASGAGFSALPYAGTLQANSYAPFPASVQASQFPWILVIAAGGAYLLAKKGKK